METKAKWVPTIASVDKGDATEALDKASAGDLGTKKYKEVTGRIFTLRHRESPLRIFGLCINAQN